MKTDIKIREAREQDANGIAHVHIKCWQETYQGIMPNDYLDSLENLEGDRRRNFWQKNLSDASARRTVWVAEEQGKIVGFISVGKCRDKEPIADGEIYAIYLLRSHQGLGVGRELFEKAIEVLKMVGMESASLWVAKGNSTEGFYRHLGGILSGEKTDKCGAIEALAEHRYLWPNLSLPQLTLKELKKSSETILEIQRLLEAAPTYHKRVNGCPADIEEAKRLFSLLPSGRTENDKMVLGVCLNGKVVGCVDLVKNYPNETTCFLGLLLIREDLQRKGYGISTYRAIEDLVRGWGKYTRLRLATVGTNSEANTFWEKMGFRETGERKPYQQGNVFSEYILFEKQL